ncbi:MAG: NAD(P)H-hydrate dehydratase [Chthoniobacterales bacterium]|nr:NAD(P)H-hydrate dehydratase [Chthoniobacterales bacterium]
MIVTTSEMIAAEKEAFERGVQASELMNQAGEGIAEVVQEFFKTPGTCVVYAGKGHNAGDALVAAHFLAEKGWNILIRLAFRPEEMALLSQSHLQLLIKHHRAAFIQELPSKVTTPLVFLDGLLGIGSGGAPRGVLRTLIEEMNLLRRERNAFVVGVDLPSGLDETTGMPFNPCVEADLTTTIAFVKKGLVADTATNNVGRLALVPLVELQAPEKKEKDLLITAPYLRALLSPRSFEVHKGMFGHVGIVAGSPGYLGAARMAATASLHAGAGLVTLYALPEAYPLLATTLSSEIMVKPVASWKEVLSEPLDALGVGPGLGQDHRKEILELVEKIPLPCVVDADALNTLAAHKEILTRFQAPRLLTPHPGEMERLFSKKGRDRRTWATDFVEQYPVTLILKGARSIVAEEGQQLAYNSTGNPGMASGGMGDVLTGVATAFLAAGKTTREAAMLAVWLCGRAAEMVVFEKEASPESLVATDLIGALGKAMTSLRSGEY